MCEWGYKSLPAPQPKPVKGSWQENLTYEAKGPIVCVKWEVGGEAHMTDPITHKSALQIQTLTEECNQPVTSPSLLANSTAQNIIQTGLPEQR